MEVTLDRRWPKKDYTSGVISINEKYFSESVEDRDRGLTSDMPLSKIKRFKVKGQTAIPKGRYEIDMDTVSPRFKDKYWAKKYGGIVPRIKAVPGWSGVLIHPLNFPEQSEGCIGPGENKVRGGVVKSVETFYRLMDNYFVPASVRGEKIYITIK